MNQLKLTIYELKNFLLLWLTQSFSTLGSSMTNFALVVWSYQAEGSALTTALLSVCSYTPYVLMSLFAGALSDKWNKKYIMLASDTFAAACTVVVLILLQTDTLQIWHLYILNGLNGLMNTFQQPASDVAVSLLIPQKHYQKASGLRTISSSLTSILTPIFATTLLSFTNIQVVIAFDLITFTIAFLTLLIYIKIPVLPIMDTAKEKVSQSVKSGLKYLKDNKGILDLILFLAAINLTASMYNAALPALILSVENGGENAYGIINMTCGIAMLIGSMLVTALPAPKNRVRVICNVMLLSMSTENFFLALGKTLPVWCLGAVLGWLCIPIMNANIDVLLRSYIPITMQGRVYSARNALQFFTIPLGYMLGGLLIDNLFEPFMKNQTNTSILVQVFGTGKGSGTAMLFFILGILGVLTCFIFRKNKHIWTLEKNT